MTIGQSIKVYRNEKGFTQSQLAELIGVSTQAISKWETGVGMPDISQVVPLARVLEISTDKLLGHTDDAFEREAAEIRGLFGGINFIDDTERAEKLYQLSSIFFNKHPDVPDIALACMECYIELYSKNKIVLEKDIFLGEVERYSNSIFRYETNSDRICKTYYLMSRAYDLCGENDRAEATLKNIPYVYGDREYWEAEVAYADKKYDVAMEKIKKSFATKARFVARSIRLAIKITKDSKCEGASEKCLALEEYMLRMLDAFLSGGDYMPYRQVFQKTDLLAGLVQHNVGLGNIDKANQYMQELLETRDKFYEFMDNPQDKHCLMFMEGDEDGKQNVSRERMDERVEKAQKALNKCSKNKV